MATESGVFFVFCLCFVLFVCFPGPRGRPDLRNDRFPTQKIQPDCRQVPSPLPWESHVCLATPAVDWVPESNLAGFLLGRKSVILGVLASSKTGQHQNRSSGRPPHYGGLGGTLQEKIAAL